MRTVAEELAAQIARTPFLEEGLAEDLINLSALARKLRPQVEQALLKPVTEAALVMALRRLKPQLRQWAGTASGPWQHVRDLTVRSELAELTFLRSENLVAKQSELLHQVRSRTHRFITFTQGVFEVTIIVDAELAGLAEKIFSGEQLIARLESLSAITIRLAEQSVNTPGVHYNILKQLAMRNINVVEIVSTYTELTVILNREQVDLAFSVLLR